MAKRRPTRRRRLLGTASSALAAALAGCSGVLGGGDDESGTDDSGDDRQGDGASSPPVTRERLAASPPYRTDQYDAAHTGRVDVSGPSEGAREAWTVREFPTGPGYNIGTPAVAGGTAYVAEGNAPDDGEATTRVYAVEAATGEIQWRYETIGTNAFGPTALVGDTVVQPVSGALIGIDAATGEETWSVTPDHSASITTTEDGAYVIGENRDGFGRDRNRFRLTALDPDGGATRWTATIAGGDLFRPPAPAVVDDTAYVATDELAALSAEDGSELWSASLDAAAADAPTVVGDAVYVPREDGTVAALSREDGAHLWTAVVENGSASGSSPKERVSSPAVADGVAYVVNSWALTAIDVESGEREWSTSTVGTHPPVVADGVAYVAGIDTLNAHDAESGDVLWSHRTDAETSERSIPVVLDGMVLFPSRGLRALVEG